MSAWKEDLLSRIIYYSSTVLHDSLIYFLRLLCGWRLYPVAEILARRTINDKSSYFLRAVKGLIEYRCKKYKDSYEICLILHTALRQIAEKTKDEQYIEAFCFYMLCVNEWKYNPNDFVVFGNRKLDEPWEQFFARQFGDISLEQVSPEIFHFLKLSVHPDWDKLKAGWDWF